jgi:FAD dependent oxidoreductase
VDYSSFYMSVNSGGQNSKQPADEAKPEQQFQRVLRLRKVIFCAFISVAVLGFATRSSIVGNAEPFPNHANQTLSTTSTNDDQQVWECEVIVVGGSLGGIAAAYHAMQAGSVTCLIELTPMLGGQVSSQGVSAIDESFLMRQHQAFPTSWKYFKQLISQQKALPSKSIFLDATNSKLVSETNSCWVGDLCFSPAVGATAAKQLLQEAARQSPTSRWGTEIAFKGVEFEPSGKTILAVNAVQRTPRDPNYIPKGRLSQEISSWYSWQSNDEFEKQRIRLQSPPGKRMIVIDATDTGELVAWANIPHRLGSESYKTTEEPHAIADNPDCTQAFTFPFVLAIGNDQSKANKKVAPIKTAYSKELHHQDFNFGGYPMLAGRSFFNYRRIISQTLNNPNWDSPVEGDMTLVNWNPGNDWGVMNPPLIMPSKAIQSSGQAQDWQGGLNPTALSHAEERSLIFSEWLMQSSPVPLTHLSGLGTPISTQSGLSLYPYIREGRRILGRTAYGQNQFMMREQDIRYDLAGGRDFSATAVGVTHYAVDMHGCSYNNGKPSGEASSAATHESLVRPIVIPLESLIPQKIDNLLIGGKAIAVSHIVNGATRVHTGEWVIGSAAGSTAAWLTKQANNTIMPFEIVSKGLMPNLQAYLRSQGIIFNL